MRCLTLFNVVDDDDDDGDDVLAVESCPVQYTLMINPPPSPVPAAAAAAAVLSWSKSRRHRLRNDGCVRARKQTRRTRRDVVC